LPGGDIANADFETFLGALQDKHPWMPRALVKHYARLYGTNAALLIGDAAEIAHLGTQFGPLLFEAELAYLVKNEWASCSADVLKRRTKHGLTVSPSQISKIDEWFENDITKTA
jgi:glycerol-3-phosphate dehydrogenase